MSRHRAASRPRYGRLAVLGASVAVTAVAVVGAVIGLPGTSARPAAADIEAPRSEQTGQTQPTPSAADPSASSAPGSATSLRATEGDAADDQVDQTALPPASGTGTRIVFDQSDQRVWLVDGGTDVRRTYPVSGSTLDNLDPGTYEVYSKSRWAVGIDDSGVMEYFVRFTQGPSGAAIGFHTIPTKDGTPLQSVRQLGTPRSHGCIRQRTPDAIALWDFAPRGATVVVTA